MSSLSRNNGTHVRIRAHLRAVGYLGYFTFHIFQVLLLSTIKFPLMCVLNSSMKIRLIFIIIYDS